MDDLPNNLSIQQTVKFSVVKLKTADEIVNEKKPVSLAPATTTEKIECDKPKVDTESKSTPAVPTGADGKSLSKNQLKKLAKQKKGGKGKMSKADKAALWGGSSSTKEKKKKGADAFGDEAVVIPATKEGDKKDVSGEMPSKYNPAAVESSWNSWWEKRGFFTPDVEKAKGRPDDEKFVMVIPPPNVTGTLHLGHALTCAIEDALTRWHRMNGKSVLWLPGTDHAGIATQVVVEKQLKKLENKTRHELGREKFLERVWEWKGKHGDIITNQLRKVGASVDWTREVFTMDDNLGVAVTEAFVRMHDMGLIYREQRLVNWCCELRTAISDIEVDTMDLEGITKLSVPGHSGKYEFGAISDFAYRVEDSEEELVVATTRLETMLGDTAVAVHPDDTRYTHLHGKFLVHPFNGRRIPIITDSILVDMDFGTGAVKVTPAHDKNDFETGKRHNLPMISIFTNKGKINKNGGEFEGLMRFDARVKIEEELTKLGLFKGKRDNKMQLPICSRSKDIVEPTLKPQWWVATKDMAKRAADSVRNGELEIMPAMHKDTWFYWLDNIREWCISRQLWWGHRIPAYKVLLKSTGISITEGKEEWIVGRNHDEAMERACLKFSKSSTELVLEQDEDVLDTWFSSGLFPFSVMGWPNASPDMEAFFPTQLLETGHDILFFWVARMVMMSLTLTDKLPFKQVYLHAMVRDKYGRKMSKSLGNVIDPLEVINGATLKQLHDKLANGNLPEDEVKKAQAGQTLDFPEGIPRCGADALRFGLLIYTVQGRDVNLDINRVTGYRMFCNKIWQATRFALSNFGDDFKPMKNMESAVVSDKNLNVRDKWILSKLNKCSRSVNTAFEDKVFGDACTAIYNFFYYELFGIYLEAIKPIVRSDNEGEKIAALRTLWLCLDNGFRLLHPIMPFVTEELWQRLPGREIVYGDIESICIAPYPVARDELDFPDSEAAFTTVNTVAGAIRALASSYNVNKVETAFVKSTDADVVKVVEQLSIDIATLGNVKGSVSLLQGDVPKACAISVVDASTSALVSLEGIIDPVAEVKKLTKQESQKLEFIENLNKKMSIPDYETKVPENIRSKNSEKLETLQKEYEGLVAAKIRFEAMI